MISRRTFVLTVVVFLFLNGLLIYANVQRQSRIALLSSQLQEHERINAKYLQRNQVFRLARKNRVEREPKTPLKVVALVTDRGCSSCIREVIQELNAFSSTYPGNVEVYYQGPNPQYLPTMGADFRFTALPDLAEAFWDPPLVKESMLLLVDSDDVVILAANITTETLPKARSFFERAERLMRILTGDEKDTSSHTPDP
jgi:hypothetical protein